MTEKKNVVRLEPERETTQKKTTEIRYNSGLSRAEKISREVPRVRDIDRHAGRRKATVLRRNFGK